MENKELIEKVQALVQEVDKTHRYSMSRVYGIHNEVFNKSEQPQSCASCLIRKVGELKQWLSEQNIKAPKPLRRGAAKAVVSKS